MKKLLFVFLMVSIFFSGCSLKELKVIQSQETFYGIDFRPYTEKGFFMTTDVKYNGEYEPIGLVTYELFPSANYTNSGVKKNPIYKEGQTGSTYYVATYRWFVDEVKLADALDGIYEYCISMGADALINLQLNPTKKDYSGIKNPVTIDGIEISGFAIRRK